MEVRGKQQKTLQAQVYTLNEHLFEPQSFRFHKQENISSKKPIKGSTKNVLSHLRDQSEREGRAGDEGGVVYITAEPQLHDHCNWTVNRGKLSRKPLEGALEFKCHGNDSDRVCTHPPF